MPKLTVFFAMCLAISTMAKELVISEIFANAPGSGNDFGQEWIEIYNPGPQPVALAGTLVRRLDGDAYLTGWKFELDAQSPELAVGGYALISQRKDLGVGLCLNIPQIVVADKQFAIKNSGLQTICIQPKEGKEDCAQITNSMPFPDGRSRMISKLAGDENDSVKWWQTEECPFGTQSFGTPGLAANICKTDPQALSTITTPCEPSQPQPPAPSPPLPAPIEPMPVTPIEPAKPLEPQRKPYFTAFDAKPGANGQILFDYQVADDDKGDLLDVTTFLTSRPITNFGQVVDQNLPTAGSYYAFARVRDDKGNESFSPIKGPFLIAATKPALDLKVSPQGPNFLIEWSTSAPEGHIAIGYRPIGTQELIPIAAGFSAAESSKRQFLWRPESVLRAIEICATLYWQGEPVKSCAI